MALLSWSDQYLIGNEQIDTEHKELFRLINNFHDIWSQNKNQEEIARVLNRLVAYTQGHFQHEEAIMEAAAYPSLQDHQHTHVTMVETIFKLQQDFEDKSLRLEMETMKFVKAWLIEHILQNDYLFRDFLVGKKRSAEQEPSPE